VTVKLYNQQNVAKTFQLTTVKDSQTVKVFTANQTKSNLAAEPHTNTYAGTANPGEKIKVLSDYGWAYGWADESGNWQVEVDFNPPAGTKTFNVTARYYNDTSVSKTFQLTTVAPAAAQFTATQKFASVSVTGPTNTLFGEGEPGHEVWLWSDGHGETSVTVGADVT
jgi:hypothetical protein